MLCQKFNLIRLNLERRFVHKYVYNMGKAYFREIQNSDEYKLTFHYKNPDIKVDRPFNFSRKLNESVDSLLGRITTNVEKIVNKKNKKKSSTPGDAKKVEVSLQCNNECVEKQTLCNEIFKTGNTVVLTVMDQQFTVLINTPWIENVSLPNSILASFPVYPNKFDAIFTDLEQSDFTWFKSADKVQWVEVGKGYCYVPKNEDIDCYLKLCCVPKNGNLEGPAVETVAGTTVGAGPGVCPFETRHVFTNTRLTGKEFRVVSYNILADLYCDSDFTREHLFPYCPPYALNIDYRKQLFRKEIIGFNADLICLQEVDRKVYKHDLDPILTQLGYSSQFSVKGGEVVEGLAFFYYKSRFELLDNVRLVFAEILDKEPLFAEYWQKISANEKLRDRIMARTTTFQINVVRSLENDEIIVVGNIHLYFHPDSDHIRLIQGGLAIKYMEDYVKKLQSKHKSRISLIFCGDFNSVPECGIYKLYTTGEVPSDFIDYQSNQEESINTLNFTQPFKLASACGTPDYTNFTAGFAACLDYIFYESTNLQVTQVVPFPSDDELRENTALPSIVFPSDHVSLIADLKFKQ